MIKFSIKRPVLTMVTMLLFIVLGAVSLVSIPLKLIPDINPPIGVVVATYDKAGPEEVNDQVAIPIEDSLSTTSGLDTMMSTAQEGSSLTLLQLTSRSEEHTSELQSRFDLVCRLLLEKKNE